MCSSRHEDDAEENTLELSVYPDPTRQSNTRRHAENKRYEQFFPNIESMIQNHGFDRSYVSGVIQNPIAAFRL